MLPSPQEVSFSSDSNPNKKSRTSRACDLCRRKKVKCDGLKPTCSNCSSLGHRCTYLDKPKKRGPQTSQPKALEARLKHLESLLTSLVDQGGSVTNQIANELRSINEHEHSSPNIESPDQDDSEDASEDEDQSVDEEADLETHNRESPQDVSYRYAGSSSGMYLLNDNIKKNRSVHDIRKLLPEAYSDVPDLPETFPPPELSEKLLKIYFCRFHPYLPVFHANGFMKKYREGKVPPILLNALYGLACIHSGDHNIFPDIESYTKYARMFFLRAKAYLDLEYHSSSIPVIQALFLMTFSPTSGWLFLGMAIRMAQDLGLHRNIESQNMDPIEREDRRLLWWCCVVMDRFQSSALGKPMTINETDFDAKLPTEIANSQFIFTNLPSPIVSLRYFTHLIRLTSIISRIMREVYGVDSLPTTTGKILWTLNKEISDWEATLPAEFKYDFVRPLKNNVHSIMLNTFCQYAIILLNRPFIPKASKNKKSSAVSPALKICSRAASIMTFISYHTPNGYRLHGVIFKTSFTFSSSMIHLISSLSHSPEIAQTGRINLSFNLRLLQEYQEISSGSARCLNFMKEIVQNRKFHKVDELPAEPLVPTPVPISPELNNKTPKRSDSAALLIIPERHYGSPINRSSGSLSPISATTHNSVKNGSPSDHSPTATPTVSTYANLNQINIADPIFQYPNISQTIQGPRNLFAPETYSSPGNYMNSQGEVNSISSAHSSIGSQPLSEFYQQDCAPAPFIGNPQFYNNHQMDINMQEWNNYIDQFSNFASPSM